MPSIYPEDYNRMKNSKTRPLFLKSHESYTPLYKNVIYIVRNGMDVAVSSYHQFLKFRVIPQDTTFDDFLLLFQLWF